MITDQELAKLAIKETIYEYGALIGFVEAKYDMNFETYSFWHWSLDYIVGDISNGSVVWVNWKSALDRAIQYDMKKYGDKDGITDICQKLYDTYGDKDYKTLIEW